MKFGLFCAVLILILAGCTSPGSSKPKTTASKVTPVAPLTASSLSSSGATVYPTTTTDLQNVLNFSDDPQGSSETSDIQTDVSGASLPTSVTDPLNSLETSFTNFFTSKSESFSDSVTNQQVGAYITINSASANLTLKGTTFNGGAIASDVSNLKTLSGSALAALDLSLVNPPTGPLRGAKVRLNFGADASTSANASGVYTGSAGTLSASINYKVSASVGLSVKQTSTNMGGKILINASSTFSNSQSFNMPSTTLGTIFNDLLGSVAPVTLAVTVYADSGVAKFTKTYDSYSAFTTDFPDLSVAAAPGTGVAKSSKSNPTLGQILTKLVSLGKKGN